MIEHTLRAVTDELATFEGEAWWFRYRREHAEVDFAETHSGRTITLTEEFLIDNPVNEDNPDSADRIAITIRQGAVVPPEDAS